MGNETDPLEYKPPTAFFVTRREDGQEFICDQEGYAHTLKDITELAFVCAAHLTLFETEDAIKLENEIFHEARERARIQRIRDNERIVPKSRGSKQFIYLCRNERNGFTKIGLTGNPTHRERTLQSQEPEVAFIFTAPGSKKIEEELHVEFAKKRVRGEWFRLTKRDVSNIKLRLSV